MEETVAAALAQRRFSMRLLGVFAAVALLLASIGIYGVMAYIVMQRGQEIGIRMALGARPWDVVRLLLQQGLLLSLTGIAIGLGGAAGLTRAMSTLLYQTSATDPATFAAISLLLALVGLAACYIPALRASRVDPIRALRHD